jgi:hypothetical protein
MNPDVVFSLEKRLGAERTSTPSPALFTTLLSLASRLKTLDPPRTITLTEEA